MEINERFEDMREAIEALIDRRISRMWTALPTFVTAGGGYDSARQVVKLTSGIKGQQRVFAADGTSSLQDVSMPQLPDVPVHFAGGGDYAMTWPIGDKDEGMTVFSSRCLDFWWQNGGEQPRGSQRRHNLADGMFIPGLRSQPNKLSNPSTTAPQIRSVDGTFYVEFAKTAVKIVFPNGKIVTIDSSGNITTPGNVTAGSGTGDSITLLGHDHSGVVAGGGNSGPPVPGT